MLISQFDDLQSEIREILAEITPNFNENLNRAFKNEGIRLQQKQKFHQFIHNLDDILLTHNDTKIELRNLKFPWVPDFRIVSMLADLTKPCIEIDLNLGHLKIDGVYETNNPTLSKFLPVSQIGKITVVFNNVRATGRVGLVIKDDSFVPQNYDISYKPNDIAIRVSYYIDGDNEQENEITNSKIEGTLGQPIWRQLTEILSNLLHHQLGEVVVEFSITELLLDQDEQFRHFIDGQLQRANRLFDSILCRAKDYLVANQYRQIKTPKFDTIYKPDKPSGIHQGILCTNNGEINDLATLTRTNSFNFYENDTEVVIYGYINLRDFKHNYDSYHGEYDGVKIDGTIKATIYKNQIFIKILVTKTNENCTTHLETVEIRTINDIDIDVSGLASLSWLSDRLKSWVIGNLRQYALPILEKYIKEAFIHAIDNTDCISLLID